MIIQLALDRYSIDNAIKIARAADPYIDWIEVGTSLIKEFGVKSIYEIRKAFPNKVIVADSKTFDNAEYEMNLCFDAGAEVATVLGVAPKVTIDKCIRVAKARGCKVMIDLASVPNEKIASLPVDTDIIWCLHISKDEQETLHIKQNGEYPTLPQVASRPAIAIAGGITEKSILRFERIMPEVVIVGSNITKATDPGEAAKKFRDAVNQLEMER